MSISVQVFLNRGRTAAVTLLVALGTVFGPPAAVAEQSAARPVFSIEAFCADPYGNMDRLQAIIRSRIGKLPSNASYDNIVEAVIDRLDDICVNGKIPEGLENQNARLNTIVRDKRVNEIRRPKAEQYMSSITSLSPRPSDLFATFEIINVINKKATSRQQIVFDLLVDGMTLEEIADQLGRSIGTIHNDKQAIVELLKTELQLSEEKCVIHAIVSTDSRRS